MRNKLTSYNTPINIFKPKTWEARLSQKEFDVWCLISTFCWKRLSYLFVKYDRCDKPIVAKCPAWPWPQMAGDSGGNWAELSGHWPWGDKITEFPGTFCLSKWHESEIRGYKVEFENYQWGGINHKHFVYIFSLPELAWKNCKQTHPRW